MAQMNLSMKQTHRHIEQSCVASRVGRRVGVAFGVSKCKLLHIEWIDIKILLYGIGSYIQCLVVNHKGKE